MLTGRLVMCNLHGVHRGIDAVDHLAERPGEEGGVAAPREVMVTRGIADRGRLAHQLAHRLHDLPVGIGHLATTDLGVQVAQRELTCHRLQAVCLGDLARQREANGHEHARLHHDEARVQGYQAETRVMAGGEGVHRCPGILDEHEQHVVHRDHRGCNDRHAPVAIRHQEREAREDVEVQLDHPVDLVDEERREGHERGGDRHAREGGPCVRAGQPERADANRPADEERSGPRAMQHGQHEGDGNVREQQPPECAVHLCATALQHCRLGPSHEPSLSYRVGDARGRDDVSRRALPLRFSAALYSG